MIEVSTVDNREVVLTNGDVYPVPFLFTKSEQLKQNFIHSLIEMANRMAEKRKLNNLKI